MVERRFPIQEETRRRDGRTETFPRMDVPWSAAETAYETYVALFGRCQTLERLAERGGFGRDEFLDLFAGRDPITKQVVSR